MKKTLLLFTALVLLALAGCEGGTIVDRLHSECHSSGGSGSCTVTIDRFEGGPYRYRVENDRFAYYGEAWVDAEVTTGRGRMRVWIEDGEGHVSDEVTVGPGEVAELSCPADTDSLGDEHSFSIYFDAVLEDQVKLVEDLRVEIEYRVGE